MKKIKKHLAVLLSFGIVFSAFPASHTSVDCSDRNVYAVTENESQKTLCLVTFYPKTHPNLIIHDFLESYEKNLIIEGYTSDEALKQRKKLFAEYQSTQKLSDAKLDAQFREYLTDVLNKIADELLSEIGAERVSDTKVLPYDTLMAQMEAELLPEQIETAETIKEIVALLTEEEIEKYNGKIFSKDLLKNIRAEKETLDIRLVLSDTFADKTDDEINEYVKDILGTAGIDKIEKIAKSIHINVYTTASPNQIEKLSGSDAVRMIFHSNLSSNPPATFIPDDEDGPEICGDILPDGVIDISDLSMLSLSLLNDITLNDTQKIKADVDKDGKVTLSDLARLKQYISNKITSIG